MKHVEAMGWTANSYSFQYRNETVKSAFHKFHTHQGLQFLFIHEGRGRIIIEGRIYEARPGMLFIFQPFQLHRIIMNNNQAGGSYLRTYFAFEPGVYEEQLKPLGPLYAFFRYLWKGELPVQAVDGLTESDPIVRLFEYLHIQLGKADESSRLAETAVFLISLLHQLRFRAPFPGKLPEGGRHERELHHVENIMQWVDEHYRAAFQLEELAGALHLSPSYVSRMFRSCTGTSITEYMTAVRIHKASNLLRASEYSVERVGEEVGYGNTSYFCQLFKRHTGYSPYQFRLQSRP